MPALDFLRIAELLLKRRDQIFTSLKSGTNLRSLIIDSNIMIIVLTALYGASMGVFPGGVQILYDAVKVPLLLLVTLYVTVPTYYIFDALFGGKLSLKQILAVLLTGFGLMSLILIALLPVNLFFILTTGANSGSSAYAFIILLNLAVYTVAGLGALTFIIDGYRAMHEGVEWKLGFLMSSLVLILVGTQMSWILRPYFNSGAVIRPVGGNFYIDVGAFVLSVSHGPILIIEALVALGLIIWTSSLASKLMHTPTLFAGTRCGNCGRALASSDKFCTYCGTSRSPARS